MTYCIALRLDDGLVFLADTRTNAGVDNISTYRKLHTFQPQPDRVFVLESAGNLASTQQVLDRIEQDLANPDTESLASVNYLSEAALYLGRLSREVVEQHRDALGNDGSSTFILGGQIAGERPDILLVYPEGNYIRASDDRPFLQIGETKYGKLMLELAVESRVDMDDALTIALSSMISAARANLSVGAPYDLALYRNGSLELQEGRIEADDPLLHELQELWLRQLLEAVAELPHLRIDDLRAS
jgi:putative proteasome-type protease